MASCPGCGTALPDAAKFCLECGTPVAPSCVQCATTLPAGAKFCLECGSAQGPATGTGTGTGAVATPQPSGPVAARRVTSVLFGDLVGFTSLSETRDQEEVRELLGRYFEECRAIIGHYGGTVEKFIGDAVMAVWGVPTAFEDDAERAVRAGLEMVTRIAALGEDLQVEGLAMRAGIVTGEVAVTLGASGQGMVAGDPVNTAARVQSVAGPGQVWVDETTRLLTSSAITYADAGSHLLRGKAEPVPLWSVRAVVSGRGGQQRADGLEAPLVGRQRELRLVKELFHATLETGLPSLVVVSGDAGTGKTRLGWEFEKYVDGLSTTVRWHSGRCLAYGEGVAYFALADAIRGRLRAPLSEGLEDLPDADLDAEPDATRLLGEGLAAYVPDEEECAWLRPRLATLLGGAVEDSFAREDLFSAWTAFLERVADTASGVVLVIDDAQHADDGLVQFLSHLMSVGRFPCLVVVLARPELLERAPVLATDRRATPLHLPALAEADMATLLDGLVTGLSPELRDTLVQRSDGIPLFAVETVRSLIDRDLVVPRGGQYVLTSDALDLDALAAPASLQALVSARLDTLAPEERSVVDRASVLGLSFRRSEIAALCPGIDLDAVLAVLLRTQILALEASRLSAERGQFRFVQSVVRQVAYGTLSRRDRKALHLAVAAVLETEGSSSDERAPIVAQHYLDAIAAVPDAPDVGDLQGRALEHLERAAARAQGLGAPHEAAGHLATALAHVPSGPARAGTESRLATALFHAGRYEEAAEHAQRAAEDLDVAGDVVGAALATGVLARTDLARGNFQQAIDRMAPHWEALREREDIDEVLLEISARMLMAQTLMGEDIVANCEERLRIAERVGAQAEVGETLLMLSQHYSNRNVESLARVLVDAAGDIAAQSQVMGLEIRALTLKSVFDIVDDLERAMDATTQALRICRRQGRVDHLEVARYNLAQVQFYRGDWEALADLDDDSVVFDIEALNVLVKTVLAAATGQPWRLSWDPLDPPDSEDVATRVALAVVGAMTARRDGLRLPQTLPIVVLLEDLVEHRGFADDFSHLYWLVSEEVLAAGDEPARAALERVLESSRTVLPRALRAHRARFLGEWALRRGDDPSAAEASLVEAASQYRQWGSPVMAAQADASRGIALTRMGRVEEGEVLLAGARDVLTSLGATGWVAALEADVASRV